MSRIFICRLYAGPKDAYTFHVLSSPAYKRVMDNNVDLKFSFNHWDKSIEKTLKQPKGALFSHLAPWFRFKKSVLSCQVK